MLPSDFPESNASFLPPEGQSERDISTLTAWRGTMNGELRIISRWRPQRAEVEAMATGASVWLHVVGGEMPPVALGCANPFVKTITTLLPTPADLAPIDEVDPMEMAEKAAAMDAIVDMVCPDTPTATAEHVVTQVARLVRLLKTLQHG